MKISKILFAICCGAFVATMVISAAEAAEEKMAEIARLEKAAAADGPATLGE